MEALTLLREKNPAIKSLVVSQFTSFLDVVQRPLRKEGFSFCRLDGTMNQGKLFGSPEVLIKELETCSKGPKIVR